jgi:hypothetical protein
MSYFKELLEILHSDRSCDNILRNVINVFSPYYLCQHFIGDEAWQWLGLHRISDKNDIMSTHNLSIINDYDIIQCQVNFFEHFVNNILPNIDKKIILITAQFQYPPLHKNEYTEIVKNHPNIVLWISQNPIYEISETYIPFPFGIAPWSENLTAFAEMLLDDTINEKTNEVAHMHFSDTNPCRDFLPKGPKCEPLEYYQNIKKAKFMISPIGDRDDCYRHYEAIGLGSIPVCNIGESYKEIFGDNMYYCNIDEIRESIETNVVNHEYTMPNRDLICFQYYKDIIYEKIRALQY